MPKKISEKELSSFLSTLKQVPEPFTKNEAIEAIKEKSKKCLARVALDQSATFFERCFNKLIKVKKLFRVENTHRYQFVQKKRVDAMEVDQSVRCF